MDSVTSLFDLEFCA